MAKKIMLVEDDNNLREIYEARLSAEGYQIVAAENGEAALAMAAKERPDMIISDVMMPKISGFEMLDILRNTDSLKNTKIIMLTALGQAEDSQRANSLGADRYLVKSQVTLEDIVKAAHDLLDDPNKMAAVAEPASASVLTDTGVETAEPAVAAEPSATAEPAAVAEPTPAPELAVTTDPSAAPETPETSDTPEAIQTTEATADPVLPDATAAPQDEGLAETAQVAEEPAQVTEEPAPVAEEAVQPAPETQPLEESMQPASETQAPGDVVQPAPEPVETAPEPVASTPETEVAAPTESDSGPTDTTSTEPAVDLPEPPSPPEEPAAPVSSGDSTLNEDLTDTPADSSPAVISIPVSDGSDTDNVGGAADPATSSSDDTSAAQAEPAAQSDPTSIQVVEPPEETSAPAAAPSAPEEQQSTEAPVAEAPAPDEQPDPAATTEQSDTTAVEEQINQFISSHPETASAAEEPSSASTQPTVEIPSVVANPDITSGSDDLSDEQLSQGPADEIPAPEQLDEFSAPVIEAPASTDTQTSSDEPTSSGLPGAPAIDPTSEVSSEDKNADQLREAAAGLEDSAPAEAASSDSTDAVTPTAGSPASTSRMRTISPISNPDAKPSIHQLLELEEAKNSALQASQAVQGQSLQAAPQTQANPANTEAATEPRPNVDAYTPTAQITPQQPPADQPVDPNSISL